MAILSGLRVTIIALCTIFMFSLAYFLYCQHDFEILGQAKNICFWKRSTNNTITTFTHNHTSTRNRGKRSQLRISSSGKQQEQTTDTVSNHPQVLIKRGHDFIYRFWYNSSSTSIATYMFDYCYLVDCNNINRLHLCALTSTTPYICVTDNTWGYECDSWGSAAWNTGQDWGYKPSIAMTKVSKGKPLKYRMTLTKRPFSPPYNQHQCIYKNQGTIGQMFPLILNIENPSKVDEGLYIISTWDGTMWAKSKGRFRLRDMYNSPEWDNTRPSFSQPSPNGLQPLIGPPNPLLPTFQITNWPNMIAMANPTFKDTMAIETGYTDENLWLLWMEFNAHSNNRSNCYVCGKARPHLGTVPLNLPDHLWPCFLSLFTSKNNSGPMCETWKTQHPIFYKKPKLIHDVSIYLGNYTCFYRNSSLVPSRFNYGVFPPGYCGSYSNATIEKHSQGVTDVYWICGDLKIHSMLTQLWIGECAPAKIIMPLHILEEDKTKHTHDTLRRNKRNSPHGSFDPHVYLDSLGIPRGVPREFKARDEVAAGFESLIPMITINKNVNWINYIYYNQQRFANYTRDALQGLAEQLQATSQMAFQNRLALDMLLAEKGGVCKLITSTTCCTYIPENTGPNGKVTLAIKKLEELSVEMKRNSGVENPWGDWFKFDSLIDWFKNIAIMIFLLFLFIAICYIIFKLIRYCINKYTIPAAEAEYVSMYTSLRIPSYRTRMHIPTMGLVAEEIIKDPRK